MRKNKQVYANYVCPKCFRKVNKCICEQYPPWTLLFIDEHIQQVIQTLNYKGYTTTGCCESHYNGDCHNIYVTFTIKRHFDELPDGFKYIKQGYGISYEYPKAINEHDFEILKGEKLNSLLQWAKEL